MRGNDNNLIGAFESGKWEDFEVPFAILIIKECLFI